jgi:two-component system LytT family sensor kinase
MPWSANDLLHQNIYKQAIINLCCYLPVGIFSVYTSIYFLTPRFFDNKKYGHFTVGLLMLGAIDLMLNYYATGIYLELINFEARLTTFIHKLDFAYLFAIWILTITVVATGIKITKRWYLQQKENLEISRKRVRIDLQLQKAIIQPAFLFQTLESIRNEVIQRNDEAAAMVVSLADILSYTLYDSDAELVPLDLELSFLDKLIGLQNIHNKQTTILVEPLNDTYDAYVPPTILLSLLHECIAAKKDNKPGTLNVRICMNGFNDKLVIVFKINHSNANNLQYAFQLKIACKKLEPLFSTADYNITTAGDKSGLILRVNVPLITDPYVTDYDYQINTLLNEPV